MNSVQRHCSALSSTLTSPLVIHPVAWPLSLSFILGIFLSPSTTDALSVPTALLSVRHRFRSRLLDTFNMDCTQPLACLPSRMNLANRYMWLQNTTAFYTRSERIAFAQRAINRVVEEGYPAGTMAKFLAAQDCTCII